MKCCGKCIHFDSAGYTVSELDKSFINTRYKDVLVGCCELEGHEFDPFHDLHGVEHYRWETHTPCEDFKDEL